MDKLEDSFLKRTLLKKKSGESVLSGACMLSLTIIVMFLLLLLFFNYYKTINAAEDIHMKARSYLLKMELNNCLDQNDINTLVADLTELGMTNIKLSGNFASTVSSGYIRVNEYEGEYGERVYLRIEGTLNVDTKTIDFLGTEINISPPMVSLDLTKQGVAVK